MQRYVQIDYSKSIGSVSAWIYVILGTVSDYTAYKL